MLDCFLRLVMCVCVCLCVCVCVCECVWNPRKHTLYQYIVLQGEGEREGKNKSKDRIVEWRRWLVWRSSFNSLTRYTQLKTVLCIQVMLMPIHCYAIIFSYVVSIISSYYSSRMLLTKDLQLRFTQWEILNEGLCEQEWLWYWVNCSASQDCDARHIRLVTSFAWYKCWKCFCF